MLADIESRLVRRIYNVGDLVGYGGSPQEVLDLLRQKHVQSILGNLDEKVMQASGRGKARASLKRQIWQTAARQLRRESLSYFRSLPREMRFKLEGKSVLLVHGSPDSIDEYIEKATPLARLRELAAKGRADVIVAGHAHQPFARRVSGTLFINTGSVGRPGRGGDHADYCLLSTGPRGLRVRRISVRYDLEAALKAVRQAGLPEIVQEMLRTGMTLEEATARQSPPPNLDRDELLPKVEAFAKACGYEAAHTRQVTRLALELFEQIQPLHGLADRERLLLECASLLHDIGMEGGRAGHHKRAMDMILANDRLGLRQRDRLVVANVARYHRKALPSRRHVNFRRLSESDQALAATLAGILRLADGLDRRHVSAIQSFKCEITPNQLTVLCRCRDDAPEELAFGQQKSDLLARQIRRTVRVVLQKLA